MKLDLLEPGCFDDFEPAKGYYLPKINPLALALLGKPARGFSEPEEMTQLVRLCQAFKMTFLGFAVAALNENYYRENPMKYEEKFFKNVAYADVIGTYIMPYRLKVLLEIDPGFKIWFDPFIKKLNLKGSFR